MGQVKKLITGSVIVITATVVASLFSYLFNMLMGRYLGPEKYGEMAALMAIIPIITVGGGALSTVVMRYSGEYYHHRAPNALKTFFGRMTQYTILAALALTLVGYCFVPLTQRLLNISEYWPVFITYTYIIFGYLIVINRGLLQGTQRFTSLSITNIAEMVLRLGIGVVLARIGLAVNGAMSGILLATAIVYFFSFIPVTKILRSAKKTDDQKVLFRKKEIIGYAIPTLISTLLMTLIISLDTIVVKHYFDAESAGVYAAVSTVAKIIMFIATPVITVMFPIITEHRVRGEKHYKILLTSLILTLLGGMIILGIYAVMPATILRILYGERYTGMFQLLPEIGLAVVFYVLVNLLSNYFLAVKQYFFLYIIAAVTLMMGVWIYLNHPSIQYVVRIFIVSFGVAFASSMLYYLYTKRQQITKMLG